MNQYYFKLELRPDIEDSRRSRTSTFISEEWIWGRSKLNARRHLLNQLYEKRLLCTKFLQAELIKEDS